MNAQTRGIQSIARITFPLHRADASDLVVMEGMTHVPFAIARVFVVRGLPGEIRGQHAHKACTQVLTCPIGSVDVLCDDGNETATFLLDKPNMGLLIPPGIWAQQDYLTPGSVLTVLCDRVYEAADYIRDYDEFKAYKQAKANP
jgi:dTDP-4-dehydrorhamnose 3,5-epimerase-like enzyme